MRWLNSRSMLRRLMYHQLPATMQQTKRPFRVSQSKSIKNEWRIVSWRMNCLPTQMQFKNHQLPAKIATSSKCLLRDHESNTRQIEWWGFQISLKSITKIDTDIKVTTVRRKQTFEGEKNHKKGGGVWIVFLKTSSFTFWRTVLRFRVWVSSESLCSE